MTQTTQNKKNFIRNSFKAIKQGIFLTLLIGGVFLFSSQVLGNEINWYSPVEFNDPQGQWTTEPYSYDESLTTKAEDGVDGGGWSGFLELTMDSAKYINRIRFMGKYSDGWIENADIDIYFNDEWQGVFNGNFANGWTGEPTYSWYEVSFTGKAIDKARIRFEVIRAETDYAYLYEFDFGYVDTLFTYSISDLATTTAYIGEIFTALSPLIYLAIGFPLAFYVISRLLRVFPM